MNGSSKPVAVGLFSIAALAFMATPIVAQTMANAADRAFLMNASEANMGEVASGMLTAQRGASSDVRVLGKRFADNHSDNEKKLSMLAKKLGVALPMHASAADNLGILKLKGLSGAAFDSAYLSMEEKGHMKNIAAFKHEAGATSNPMVAAYVKSSLPVLEEHLELATDNAHMLHMGAMGSMSGSHMSGSGSAGSQNSGKTGTSGGQFGSPASSGAGGNRPGNSSLNSPLPTSSGPVNLNPQSGGQIGTPASNGAGGTGNPNAGPNASGSGATTPSAPAGAPRPTTSPAVPPAEKPN